MSKDVSDKALRRAGYITIPAHLHQLSWDWSRNTCTWAVLINHHHQDSFQVTRLPPAFFRHKDPPVPEMQCEMKGDCSICTCAVKEKFLWLENVRATIDTQHNLEEGKCISWAGYDSNLVEEQEYTSMPFPHYYLSSLINRNLLLWSTMQLIW